MKNDKALPAKPKKTPVRFFLTEEEKNEVDRFLEPYGGNRGTFAKRQLLATVRSKQQ